ncbi:MAG: sarcosine oxidase subunit gamma family protein [Pseudomonadota bacterium]
MPEAQTFSATRVSPWSRTLRPGRFGNTGNPGLLLVRPLRDVASIAVIARKPGPPTSIAGLTPPEVGRFTEADSIRVAADGPGQWRVMTQSRSPQELFNHVRDEVGAAASVIDQSHGWATIEMSGMTAPDVLAKGSSIDFHLSQFGPGASAPTLIHHMAVHLCCIDDTPTYTAQVFRSMTGSFATWLKESAATFGFEVEGA